MELGHARAPYLFCGASPALSGVGSRILIEALPARHLGATRLTTVLGQARLSSFPSSGQGLDRDLFWHLPESFRKPFIYERDNAGKTGAFSHAIHAFTQVSKGLSCLRLATSVRNVIGVRCTADERS